MYMNLSNILVKNHKSNEIGWLLLTVLDKVGKEKYGLRDSDSQGQVPHE